MNGYANAIQGDIDTIKVLQRDEAKLKRFSQVAVNRYMEKVTLLNQDDRKEGSKRKPVITGSNTMSF